MPLCHQLPSDRSVGDNSRCGRRCGCAPGSVRVDGAPVAIDLTPTPEARRGAEATRRLVRERILRLENEYDGGSTAAGGDAFREKIQQYARDAGVFAPHAPTEFGGMGMVMRDRAAVFAEAGYSVFGPTALHIA